MTFKPHPNFEVLQRLFPAMHDAALVVRAWRELNLFRPRKY